MALKHSNPTGPRIYQKKQNNKPVGPRHEVTARAPYNFVPLPGQMVPAPEPPAHDRYHAGRLTGTIHCTLETRSPTYVRGMLTRQQFREQGRKKPKETTVAEKENQAPFFSYGDQETQGEPQPAIPGSSLRGLVRQLVEIAGHGRMRWVADRPTFTFRAVAAQRDDPLAQPYQNALGQYGRNVRAGYLHKDGDEWSIRPAQTPGAVGWNRNKWDQWVKVVEEDVIKAALPGFKPFDHDDYRPQVHKISFEHGPRVRKTRHRRGKPDRPSIRVGPPDKYQFSGQLVTSGSMSETGGSSPRRNHAIILPADDRQQPVPLQEEAIEAYRKGLTPYQEENLGAWAGGEWGVLAPGKPVFYVQEGGQVVYFGHSPNFRVPARLQGTRRAATPRDFVPADLRDDPRPDLADAIFGWVKEEGGPAPEWADRKALEAYAGRVFFEDAQFTAAEGSLWYTEEPLIPKTLAGPKPTTFQHYLVQNAAAGHDPDKKSQLAHYGTARDETQIRGYKLYWHKGDEPEIAAEPEEDPKNPGTWKHESQYTRIRPLNPGVQFTFDVHFENLLPAELGALLWALALPGADDGPYCHKLGMGKPLGMGAVAIHPSLELSRRSPRDEEKGRYQKLFAGGQWYQPRDEDVPLQSYLDAFTAYVLQHLPDAPDQFTGLERIQMLLELLRWRDGSDEWLNETRYMEIEHEVGNDDINEYVERPVLPDPLVVVGKKTPSRSQAAVQQRRTQQRQQEKQHPPQQAARTPARSDDGSYKQGTVKMWGGHYGFVTPFGGGKDIHVPKEVLPAGLDRLIQGQRVRVRTVRTDRGLQAIEVILED